MSLIGKRIRKKATLALILCILLGLCSEYLLVNGLETVFQKIRLTPTDVSWELDDEDFAGKSIFSFVLNVIIYNPNNEPFCVTYTTELIQFVNTIAVIELENGTETDWHSGGLSFCQVMDYRQINPGTTTNQSKSTLYIEEEGLTNLPDGNYTFSAGLFRVNSTDFTSDKLHLDIKDGIPIIYTSSPTTLTIDMSKIIFIPTIFTIFIIVNLRKRNKE